MALSKFAGDIKFVEPVPKNFDCSICLEVLKTPFLTACCGNHFCEGCVNSVKQSTCPVCCKKPISGIVNKHLHRQLNELKVYCPQTERGCQWVGEWGEVDRHMNQGELDGQCKFVLVSCTLSCGLELHRSKLKEHVTNDCELRPYSCEHCSYESTFEQVTQHYSKCLSYPLVCPYFCTKSLLRSQLEEHLADCPNKVVSCSFSDMGCKETMKRGLLQKHMEENILQHQMIMCQAFREMKEENQKLKDEQKMAEFWIAGYKLMAEEVKKSNWRIYLPSMAVLATSAPESLSPVVIKWSAYANASQTCDNGKHLYAKPFYTHHEGYKMQLRLYPNGTENANGYMSVYVHIVRGEFDDVLQWPFKGSVTVTLLNQLENAEHHEVEVWLQSDSVPLDTAGKPPSDSIKNEKGWGINEYIALSKISDFTPHLQYLVSDALYFRVTTST